MDSSWSTADYLLSPRVIFVHFVSFGLVYSLIKQGTSGRDVIWTAARLEVVVFIAWFVLPEAGQVFAVIASTYVALTIYQDALGEKINVRDGLVLRSDFELRESLENLLGKNFEGEETRDEQGRYCISCSELKYVQRVKETDALKVGILDVDDIINVDLESITNDEKLGRSLRRLGIQPECCMSLKVGALENKSTILITPSLQIRDDWLLIWKELIGKPPENEFNEWMDVMLGDEREGDNEEHEYDDHKNNLKSFTMEDCLKILNKIKRKIDHNYMMLIFQGVVPSLAEKSLVRDLLPDFALTRVNSFSKKNKNKNKTSSAVLTSEQFSEFYRQVVITTEVEEVFRRLQGLRASTGSSLSPAQFKKFIKDDQKEIKTKEEIEEWISENEKVLTFYNLSTTGFSNYLFSDEHSAFNVEHLKVYQDMDQPLSHYFIATSHNTYLTKDQLKGKSSVDAYVNAFKRGCKCVELDCWDGPNNEPIIYHGHTLTSKILFRDVIQAIKDYAFCVSPYPVILSFENHCTVEQQKAMARHLRSILGDLLYTSPISEDERRLPSPNDLSGYVIVKAKKLKPGQEMEDDVDDDFSDDEVTEEALEDLAKEKERSMDLSDTMSLASVNVEDDDDVPSGDETMTSTIKQHKISKLKSLMQTVETLTKDGKKEKAKVPKLAQELSDLVFYCQATGFRSFEYSAEHSKHYEMSSFAEKKSMKFSKENCTSFLNYNERQLSRIYPSGVRIDSSNYNPVTLWNVGCQLVALNYQTACREMQLNQGLFQNNGQCGYVLKPEFMRTESVTFDPRGPFSTSQTVSIRIISGHQLPYKHDRLIKSERNYQVHVRVEGVEADVQQQRTSPVKNNGYNPKWDEVLLFKIHVPELALVSFSVCTKTLIAQQSLPFLSLKQGFRRVALTNKYSEPLTNAYLLIRTEVN